ncbi:MAG: helix-turn-helix transcriptional regulator [Caulobacteraceae bacterium]
MQKATRSPWYLRQWRKHRGYSLERLAEMIGTSKGYLSDLERGNRRYNQELLELLAEALSTQPSNLINVDPSQGEDTVYSIWETLTPVQRRQALAVIKAIKEENTGTDG